MGGEGEMVVEEGKEVIRGEKREDCGGMRSVGVKGRMEGMKEMLEREIGEREKEMLKVINGDERIGEKYEVVKSVDGVGVIRGVEVLRKRENLRKISRGGEYGGYGGSGG